MLKNYIEDVVDQLLPTVLRGKPEICNCEACLLDIKAIALNNLPPKYTVTTKGSLLMKTSSFNLQFETDVLKEITKAVEIVSKLPRH